jgi:DNA-binding FadR family transcriptional regulator
MRGERKADRVADDLLRRIVRGELEVGVLLPKEDELASRYDVNRSVVREAIKLLEVHRLVRPVRRRGTEVLDPKASLSPEVLEAMLVPEPGHVDHAMLAELLEIRAALDVELTGLAAARRTDDDLASLEACLASVREASTRAHHTRYDDEVDRFVRLLARATQNRIFEMLVAWNQQVSRELTEIFRAARPVGKPHVDGMALVLDLVRQKKRDEVRALVSAYHEWAIPRMLAAAALRTGASLDSIRAERLEE